MASNLQHTPGPWSFEGPKRSIIVWGPEPGQRICFMTSDGPATENARLIASAPTMAARIAELEADLAAERAKREEAEQAASNVTSETFRYYLAEAKNGLCTIPRRVVDDMWLSYMRSIAAREAAEAEAARLREAKDGAYEERNKVVAALARLFPSGLARTDIPGWSPDWHGCVYIDLPTGQVSWHFHDSQAVLFAGLPAYSGAWDGHDTDEKYRRLAALGGEHD